MSLCPFHRKMDGTEERHPSFALNLSTGLYFCHSCHEKGNLFTFLRDIGLSRDVIERDYRYLIDSASTNLPPPPDALRCRVFDLMPIEESLLGLFEFCPIELLQQGFKLETLRTFEVGYDKWFGRITYPLRDLSGKLVGLMGRNADGYGPRYKVYTKEYPMWGLPERTEPDKRLLLWNGFRVYTSLYLNAPTEPVVVVEGFKAAMWVYQAGVKNVVALLGSYLSWEHQWTLERIGAPVLLFLDNNYAGRKGTFDAAEVLKRSLDVRIVEYPERLEADDDAQPDSLTPDEVVMQTARAPSYLNWMLKLSK